MKFQILFSGGNKKNISNCRLLKVLPRVLCVKQNKVQYWFSLLYEPAHDKTYNKTCPTSEDSGQPAHPRSLISLR